MVTPPAAAESIDDGSMDALFLQKHTHEMRCYDAMCWFSSDAMIFCNNFAQSTESPIALTLQDDYKR